MNEHQFSADYLREVFSYSQDEGVLRWKRPTCSAILPGSVAGHVFTTPDGQSYVRVKLNGTDHRAHRIIWCMVTGEWPSSQIDHRDTDGLSNKFSNLRQASNTENGWNQKKKRNNSSGFKGVHFQKASGKWIARIRIGKGSRLHLGSFDSIEDASAAYVRGANQYHGSFARAA